MCLAHFRLSCFGHPHEDFQQQLHYEAEAQKIDHILQVIKNILRKTSLIMVIYSISFDIPSQH